jgi:hypothetical protein
MAFGALVSGVSSGPITSSGAVKASPGTLIGYLVCSTSSGTIKAYDNATGTSTAILHDTLTPAAGQFIPCNMAFANGLYLTIGGTISVVAVYV